MQILNISPKELDYVAILCVDPSLPPKWRKEMEKPMEARKEWLKSMMKKGLQVLVALEKSENVLGSLNTKNQKLKN